MAENKCVVCKHKKKQLKKNTGVQVPQSTS